MVEICLRNMCAPMKAQCTSVRFQGVFSCNSTFCSVSGKHLHHQDRFLNERPLKQQEARDLTRFDWKIACHFANSYSISNILLIAYMHMLLVAYPHTSLERLSREKKCPQKSNQGFLRKSQSKLHYDFVL